MGPLQATASLPSEAEKDKPSLELFNKTNSRQHESAMAIPRLATPTSCMTNTEDLASSTVGGTSSIGLDSMPRVPPAPPVLSPIHSVAPADRGDADSMCAHDGDNVTNSREFTLGPVSPADKPPLPQVSNSLSNVGSDVSATPAVLPEA